MALQMKNGDAAYYQSAEFCRNYTSPPVSYGDSSHYLARLPGKERLAIQDLPSYCQQYALTCKDGENLTRHLQMAQRKVDVETGCPGAAVIIIMSCRGVHQPSFCAAYRTWMLRCKIWGCYPNGLLQAAVEELYSSSSRETPGLSWCLTVIWNRVQPQCNVHFHRSSMAVNHAVCCQSKWRNINWIVAAS